LKHYAAPGFWEAFDSLDPGIQKAARGAFHLMKSDPRHPGVRLKKKFLDAYTDAPDKPRGVLCCR
jgi:hypothetical protein